jgi:hypothetical protein
MKRKTLIGLGVAAALAAGVSVYSYGVSAEGGPGYGPGWGMMGGLGLGGGGPCPAFGADEGQGFGPGYHMRGWRGGYGPGWMMGRGPGYDRGAENLNLNTDDVKNRIERWLTWRGNPRFKVGEVKEKDADTITADIVTKDNSLVQRFIVNRHSGTFRQDNS